MTCLSTEPEEEALATTAVCKDTEPTCFQFVKFCGKNSYVDRACKKTCGQCGISQYVQCYL